MYIYIYIHGVPWVIKMQLISRDVISLCYCNLLIVQALQWNTTIFILNTIMFLQQFATCLTNKVTIRWNSYKRHYPCVWLWSENGFGCGHWRGLPLGETGPQSSVANWRCVVLGRLMQCCEAERLRRSGLQVERRRPGFLRPGPPGWSGCGAAACWTRCFSGSRPAGPVPGPSGGAGIGTVCGPPSLRASGVCERIDHGMMTGGILARSWGWCRARPSEVLWWSPRFLPRACTPAGISRNWILSFQR